MGWFKNRLMRGATNRSFERLAREHGPGIATGILALGMGYACYPDATYGDNGVQDEIVSNWKRFTPRPCNASAACGYVEAWLDRGELSTVMAFIRVWGMNQDELLMEFMQAQSVGKFDQIDRVRASEAFQERLRDLNALDEAELKRVFALVSKSQSVKPKGEMVNQIIDHEFFEQGPSGKRARRQPELFKTEDDYLDECEGAELDRENELEKMSNSSLEQIYTSYFQGGSADTNGTPSRETMISRIIRYEETRGDFYGDYYYDDDVPEDIRSKLPSPDERLVNFYQRSFLNVPPEFVCPRCEEKGSQFLQWSKPWLANFSGQQEQVDCLSCGHRYQTGNSFEAMMIKALVYAEEASESENR